LPGKPIFPPEAAAEASTSRLMDRAEPAAFIPCRHESGVCLIFIRRPAIHMFGKRTLPETGKKEDRRGRRRPSEEEVLDVPGLL